MVKLVGILNITPDSFSDGGKYFTDNKVLNHCRKLILDGADIIDIGAESTRPNAKILSDDQELARLKPVLPKILELCHHHEVLVSIDTYHPQSAAYAINLGVDFINDVSSFYNINILQLAKNSAVSFIVMHNLGIHANPNLHINIKLDPIDVINDWIVELVKNIFSYNIRKERIIIDPGIGFGKTAEQSIYILQNLEKIKHRGFKILVSHSRKSCLNLLYPNISSNRDQETLEISRMLILKQVDFLRVHDISIHKNLLG